MCETRLEEGKGSSLYAHIKEERIAGTRISQCKGPVVDNPGALQGTARSHTSSRSEGWDFAHHCRVWVLMLKEQSIDGGIYGKTHDFEGSPDAFKGQG